MVSHESVELVLDRVRPYLMADGRNVELVAIVGNDARIRLTGMCAGCPSSHLTLYAGIEVALRAAVADFGVVEIAAADKADHVEHRTHPRARPDDARFDRERPVGAHRSTRLARNVIQSYATQRGVEPPRLTPHVEQTGCVVPQIVFDADVTPVTPSASGAGEPASLEHPHSVSLDDRLREVEAALIGWALRVSGGNKSRAAELLQVKRTTLADRISRHGARAFETAGRAATAGYTDHTEPPA